ncbi:hypothetical protein JYT86_00735 [bacterium AH-315-N03]|nr:hypothetical protein [bacterium AH-315-N03]
MEMRSYENPDGSGSAAYGNAFWVNGELVRRGGQIISYLGDGFPNGSWLRDKWSPEAGGTPFEGFRWRSASELLVNYVWLYVYTEEDSYDIPVWYDDVVVATSYIGPIYRGSVMPRDAGTDTDGGGAATDAGGSGTERRRSGARRCRSCGSRALRSRAT